jgi:Flp pilus assembly protein TadD
MSSDLLNFDDNEYFENYPEVSKLTLNNIIKYFTSYYVLMYQPLPILSFALTYSFVKLDPTIHHTINLLFHIFNTYLVYLFVRHLTNRPFITRSVTFLFALHPMAVEAVMWFSCRSSGMYVCFYLLGLLSYLSFKQKGQSKYLIFCGIWFLLSLLSKAQAVTFPIALMVIDVFVFKESFGKKLIVNKIPFFLLSLLFGIVTLLNKDTVNNISYGSINYTLVDYIFLLNYELFWYFLKVVWPFDLSPIVVYPPKVNGMLPLIYYLSPIFIIGIALFAYRNFKKRPFITFGLFFFLAILSVSLQILPSRQVIVADRYSYLPNIGLFFVLSNLLYEWKEGRLGNFKVGHNFQYIIFLVGFILCFLSFNQIKIWKNNETLATRIIDANPETDYIGRAYGIRANYKKDNLKDYEGALLDYKKAIDLDSADWIAYYQMGLIYKSLNNQVLAIENFEKAHHFNPQSFLPLSDIGVIHLELKNYNLSLKFADSALKVSPNSEKTLNLKAACLLNLGQSQEAETFFSKAILINPNYTEAIKNRGIVRLNYLNNKAGACEDFKKALELGEPGMDKIISDYCK